MSETRTFSSGLEFSQRRLREFSVLANLPERPSRRLVILSISSMCSVNFKISFGFAGDRLTFAATSWPSCSLRDISSLRASSSAFNTSNFWPIRLNSSFWNFFFFFWLVPISNGTIVGLGTRDGHEICCFPPPPPQYHLKTLLLLNYSGYLFKFSHHLRKTV